MKTYTEYLNKISDKMANSGNPVENGEGSNVATVVGTDVTGESNNSGNDDEIKPVDSGSANGNPVEGGERSTNSRGGAVREPTKPRNSVRRVVEQKPNQDPEGVAQYGFKLDNLSDDSSREAFGIPSGSRVYTKGNDGYLYYKDGNNFVGINKSQPYFKVKTTYAGSRNTKELNLCKAGETSLNTKVNKFNSEYKVSLTKEGYRFSCPILQLAATTPERKDIILNGDDINNILNDNIGKVVDKVRKENNYWANQQNTIFNGGFSSIK